MAYQDEDELLKFGIPNLKTPQDYANQYAEQGDPYGDDEVARQPASDPLSPEDDETDKETDEADLTAEREVDNQSVPEEITSQSNDLLSSIPKSQSNSQLSKYQDFLNEYKALQDQRRKSDLVTGLIAAGGKIGQSMAGKYSGNFNPDQSGIQMLQKMADRPVQDFEQRQIVQSRGVQVQSEMDSHDPKSPQSRLVRKYINEKFPSLQLADDVSAADAQLLLKTVGKPGIMKPQLSQYLNKGTGNPIIYDQQKNKMIDSVTGEQVNSGDFVRNYTTKDAHGNIIYTGGPGQAPVTAVSSKYGAIENMKPEQVESFQPDKEQRDAIKDSQASLNKQNEIAQKQFNAISKIKSTLSSNNKLSSAVIRTQMPRLSGEVGNLNESEQQVWTGSQAVNDQIEQWLSSKANSEITDTNKKELLQLINIFEKSITDAANQAKDRTQQQLEVNYAIPRIFSTKGLTTPGSLRKEAPTNKVRVRNVKTGQVGLIPKENLQKALNSEDAEGNMLYEEVK